MEGLAASDREFVLEWLADHGANARDELFLPAAMTARLIIEQTRVSNTLKQTLTSDVAALQNEIARARAVAVELRQLQDTMREETLRWETSARDGLKSGLASAIAQIDQRISTGAQKLAAALEGPIRPLVESLEALPNLASAKADEAARKGIAAATAAVGPAIVRWFRPRVVVIVAALAILAVTASYFAGRWAEAHSRAVPVQKHAVSKGNH